MIIYGPNGVGKTKLLELVAGVSNGALGPLHRIPFRRAVFEYEDGAAELVLNRVVTLDRVSSDSRLVEENPQLAFELRRAGEPSVEWRISRDVDAARGKSELSRAMLQQRLDFERHRILEDIEIHGIDDSAAYIWHSDDRWAHYRTSSEEERTILEFLRDAPAHMVETQRLLMQNRAERKAGAAGGEPPAVVEHAADLARRISAALAENSAVSQRLDRSFPRRLLTRRAPNASLSDRQIRQRYDAQSAIRDQLAEISVVDAAEAIELPGRKLEPWERKMLNTYMDDADEKLATFLPLLRKLSLLTEIVNSRFLYKRMRINKDRGFQFETDEGAEIALSDLSSGEQHELVLNYDLLFNVEPGSLVLIDEPEISLHVAWQQKFLEDIESISGAVGARFMVATHSPQIIHNWRSRAHSLYRNENV